MLHRPISIWYISIKILLLPYGPQAFQPALSLVSPLFLTSRLSGSRKT
jgi:hypothetical protein